MKNKIWFFWFFAFHVSMVTSQSISSSPYSVYGLGSLYDSNFGPVSAMGTSGIALPSKTFINNRNPASLSFIPKNSFFFDVGGNGIQSVYESKANKESKNNFQFSHLAFAFPINSKSGASLSIQPYSSAAYQIANYELPIENSTETYFLAADSKGGLNSFDVAYGYKISPKMGLGISTSVLFGSIEDNRYYTIGSAVSNIYKNSYYNGIRLSLGNQYAVDSTLTLGFTLKMPTKVSASKVQSVITKNSTGVESVETETASDVDDYYLPFEFGAGFNKVFRNNISLNFDYEKSFWNATNQSSLYGTVSNQNKFALGFSYQKQFSKNTFFEKIQYHAGINYDTGFLEIGSQKVTNRALSIGFGFPLENNRSFLNISYSYGQKGKISNELLKENYHKIGINLSLEGLWFMKTKFN